METRRLRYDLIEVFKIVQNIDKVDARLLFKFDQANRRGHTYKMLKIRSRLDIRKYSFSNRVVNNWNNLTHTSLNKVTVNEFNGYLDKYLRCYQRAYKSQKQTPCSITIHLFNSNII